LFKLNIILNYQIKGIPNQPTVSTMLKA